MPSGVLAHPEVNPAGPSFREQREAADVMRQQREKQRKRAGSPADGKKKAAPKQTGLSEEHHEMQATLKLLGTSNHRAMMDLFEGSGLPPGLSDTEVTISFEMFTAVQDRLLEARRDLEKTKESLMQANQRSAEMQSRSVADRERMINLERKTEQATEYAKELRKGNAELSMQCQAKEGERRRMEEQLAKTRVELRTSVESGMEVTNELAVVKSNVSRLEAALERAKRDAQEVEARHAANVDALNAKAKRAAEGGPGSPSGAASTAKVASLTSQVQRLKEQLADMSGERDLEVKVRKEESAKLAAFRHAARQRQESLERCAFEAESRRAELAQELRELQAMLVKAQSKNQKSDEEMDAFRRLVALSKTDAFTLEDVFNELQTIRNRVSRTPLPSERRLPAGSVPPELLEAGFAENSVRWLEDADAALSEETPEAQAARKRAPGSTLYDVLDSERDSAVAMCSSAVESMRLLVQLERLCEESTNLTDVLKTWRKVKPKWQEGISRFALEGLKALHHSVGQAQKAERAAHKLGEEQRHAFWLKKVDNEYKLLVPEANSEVQATVDVADQTEQSDRFVAPFLSGMCDVECATDVSRPVDSYSVEAGMWTDVDYKIPDWVERLPQAPAELQADPRQLFDNLPSRVVTLHRTITTLAAVIRKRLGLKVGATTDPVEFLEKLNERPNVADAWQLIELDDDITKAMLAGILQSKDDALRRVLLHKKKAEMHDSERTIEVYKGRPAADRKAVSFKERSRLAHFRQTKGATEQELRNTHFDDATLFRMAAEEAREDEGATADDDAGDSDIAPFDDDDDDADPGADTEDFFASQKDEGGMGAAASKRGDVSARSMMGSKRKPAPPVGGGMAALRKAATAMTASKRMTKSAVAAGTSANKPASSVAPARPTTRAAPQAPPKKPAAKAGTSKATARKRTAAVTIGGEEVPDASAMSDRSVSPGAESAGSGGQSHAPTAMDARADESTRTDVDIMFDEADEAPEENTDADDAAEIDGDADDGDGDGDDAAPLQQQDTLLPVQPDVAEPQRTHPADPTLVKETADADTMAGCPAALFEHRHAQTEPIEAPQAAKPPAGILALTREAGESSQWHVAPPVAQGSGADEPTERSASPSANAAAQRGSALAAPRRGGRPGAHRRQQPTQSPTPATAVRANAGPSPTAESPTTQAPQFDVHVIEASSAYEPPSESPGPAAATPPQQGGSLDRGGPVSESSRKSPLHGAQPALQIGTTPPSLTKTPVTPSRRGSHAAGRDRRKSYSRSLATGDDGSGEDMSTSLQLDKALGGVGGGFGIVSTSATMASRQASPHASRRASMAPVGRQSPQSRDAPMGASHDGPLVVSQHTGSPAVDVSERDRRREAALQQLERQAAANQAPANHTQAAAATGSPRMPNVQSKLEEMQQRRREAQLQRAARGRGATPNRADTQAQPLPSVFGAQGSSGIRGGGTMRAARLTTPRAPSLSASDSPGTPGGGFGIFGSPAGAPISVGGPTRPTRPKSPPRTAPTQTRLGRQPTQFPQLPGTPVDAPPVSQRTRRDSSAKKDLSALLFGGGKQQASTALGGASQPTRPSTQQAASPGRARGGIAAARTRAAVEEERVKLGLRESGQPPPHVRIPSKQASPARTSSHSPASARGGQEFASLELAGIAKNRAGL